MLEAKFAGDSLEGSIDKWGKKMDLYFWLLYVD